MASEQGRGRGPVLRGLCRRSGGAGGGSGVGGGGIFVLPLMGNSVYDGSMVEGRREGKGRQVSAFGEYKGEFQNGVLSGSGNRSYSDGGWYKGEWRHGMKEGKGKQRFHDGDEYEGHFVGGKPHGLGIYRHRCGDVYEGNFEEGRREGHGIYQYRCKTECKFVGNFVNNKMHGHGQLTFSEGGNEFVYCGEFEEGIQEGQGTLDVSNGVRYEGEFRDEKFHGSGLYFFSDGSCYQGEFRDGTFDGDGTYSEIGKHGNPSMRETFIGKWKNGNRHGSGIAHLNYGCDPDDSLLPRCNAYDGSREFIKGTWLDGVREGDFLHEHSWGKVTYESFKHGKRTAFVFSGSA